MDVRRAMEGKTLTAAHRRGKYMWVVLQEEGGGGKKKQKQKQGQQPQQQNVLFHMGMTGSLVVKGKEVPQASYQRIYI